jgi:hypothetical protein
MPTIRENDFSAHLRRLTLGEWQRLLDLIPTIQEHEGPFGRVITHLPDGQLILPAWVGSPVVGTFHKLVYELGLVVSFDWPDWEEGRTALLDTETDFTGYDTETLCRFITTIVRADRFNDGFLVRCFENGQITKILLALREKVVSSP